jgi:hypothetical protein
MNSASANSARRGSTMDRRQSALLSELWSHGHVSLCLRGTHPTRFRRGSNRCRAGCGHGDSPRRRESAEHERERSCSSTQPRELVRLPARSRGVARDAPSSLSPCQPGTARDPGSVSKLARIRALLRAEGYGAPRATAARSPPQAFADVPSAIERATIHGALRSSPTEVSAQDVPLARELIRIAVAPDRADRRGRSRVRPRRDRSMCPPPDRAAPLPS